MGHTNLNHPKGRRAVSFLCTGLLVFVSGAPAFGQYAPQYPQQYPPQTQQYPQQYPQQAQQYPQQAQQYPQQYPAQAPQPPNAQQQAPQQPLMPPQQLDDLVAPIALYPDPLLGQLLAASTYPLEVVEAGQWMQQNGNLHGQDLINAARQQNWDPSVQALVAFPDVLAMLNRDVRWTTDLGNAFLAQQQDVESAIQRMRVRAEQNGKLSSNPQQTVTTEQQNGQSAVVIEPSNPQYVYVPEYNPDYIWGPPAYGYYPPLWYPSVGFGFGFYPGIYIGGFFPGFGIGFGGWGLGWGWGFGWFGGGLFLNAGFFSHWGFHPFFGGRFGGGFASGRVGWEHDPFHRGGVPYANRAVASRFAGSQRFSAGRVAGGNAFSAARSGSFNTARGGFGGEARGGFGGEARGGASAGGGWQHFGSTGSGSPRGFGLEGRGATSGGWQHFGSPATSAQRGFAESQRGFSSQSRGAESFRGNSSAPRSSGGGGGGHQFGGGGGGHTSGGGGHSFGGGGSHGRWRRTPSVIP
jgi:hypothetical protein